MSSPLDQPIEKNTFLHFSYKSEDEGDESPQLRRVQSWSGSFSESSTIVNSSGDSSVERSNSMDIPADETWSLLTQQDEGGYDASPCHTIYDCFQFRMSSKSWADIDEDEHASSSNAFDAPQLSSVTRAHSRASVTTISSTAAEVRSPTNSSSGKDAHPKEPAPRRESEIATTQFFEADKKPKYRQVRISGTKQRPPQTVYMSEAPWTEVLPVRKRNPSKPHKYGRSRVPPPQKDTRNLPKYLCTYFVGIEDGPEFTVAKRIIGPQGRNMKYIADEAQGSKIRLRGKGSMFKERETGFESKEPLQINVSVTGRQGYKRAKELVSQLLREIYFEFFKAFGEMKDLNFLEDPRNPPQ